MNVRRWMPILIGLLLALPAGIVSAQELSVRRGWLGFAYEDSREDGRAIVRIEDVYPGSPAAAAGLREGDEIVQWNGRTDVSGALQALRLEPGDTIRLRVRRGDGRERDLVVVANRKPDELAGDFAQRVPEMFVLPREQAERMQQQLRESQRELERAFRGQNWQQRMQIDSLQLQDALREGQREMERVFRDEEWKQRFEADSVRLREGFGREIAEALMLRADSLHRGLELMLRDSLGPQLRALREEFRWAPDAGARTVIAMGRRSVAGAEFEEMNRGLSAYFGTDQGALVLRVSPGTPAAKAGLQPGDVVLQANDRPVDSVDDLRSAVARAQGQRPRAVELEILRKGERQDIDLRWE